MRGGGRKGWGIELNSYRNLTTSLKRVNDTLSQELFKFFWTVTTSRKLVSMSLYYSKTLIKY